MPHAASVAAPAATLSHSRGRAIATACAVFGGGALLLVAAGLTAGSDPTEGWRLAARWTARLAFLVFVPVYVASAWQRLAPGPTPAFLLRNRRALGLGFASAHFTHLAALTLFFVVSGERPEPVVLAVGGGTFVALALLTATSNDAAVRRLGFARWKRLHRVGVHALWFVFAFTYFGRLGRDPLFFAPLFGLAMGALGLRLAAWWQLRRRRAGA